ncbi:hypothetical protein P7C71_g5843, partial [Lecanoromycetidae sp. Uapishka_2]
MASSPPASPPPARPMSAIFQAGRSQSRMSVSSKQGGGSRASDEDGKPTVSVKVAVRVRPPLRPTDPGFELVPQRFQRSMVHNLSATSLAVDSPQGRKLFLFDRVFGEDVYQEGVWEYLQESVNAFVQGYNVSVLAYGQSGSGKSYTMGTSGLAEQSDPRIKGVIPRAAAVLFEKLTGPPSLTRSGSSGLRTPTRYSMHSTQSLAQLAKANASAERNWQMKATYVERARAIQSKPQIQQTSDDGDKQALIDRLRAEVSFLRDQIRNSERGMSAPQERSERQNEREVELQNHLLDVQENYSALSQRHAKLISEITKARDDEHGETPTLTEAIGDSAVERLKRSNSFAEAVEQVVLEYEKTIQSLETSLSNTRSSLASTESTLLEKENKCAYVETLNQQLQNRVQKLMDRDSDNEQYLHNLEARLDGQSSGDEKTAALVLDLRKEIARIRANEAQCEDYISTLEERLAEADQDMELKQRELDRLEHVVERQRSLGKLDSLLYEFDHLPPNGAQEIQPSLGKPLTNGVSKSSKAGRLANSQFQEAIDTAIPESDDEDTTIIQSGMPNGHNSDQQELAKASTAIGGPDATAGEVEHQSPAQSKAVADKLEDVTQELFDLQVQHESTVNEFDMIKAKYHEALLTLAELQDSVDEARHPAEEPSVASPVSTRPTSFLGDARVHELKDGGQLPSSRSLSSELSLAGDSRTSLDTSVDGSPRKAMLSGEWSRTARREKSLIQENEELRSANIEKDEGMKALNGRYSELQELHAETLDIIEELKTEVQKARMMRSPTSPTSPVIRRKSSQNVMTIDRAHRSFASLRNIATENLEDKPDTMQSFEINLNTAMHELHQRSERVQLLETELATLKKEMETKSTMISGLTRERSSLKTSTPMDMTVVSTLHGQLMENENQMRMLQEKHSSREQELVGEVQSLRRSLEQAQSAQAAMPGFFPETPATSYESDDKQLGSQVAPKAEVEQLQAEVSQWQEKHSQVVDSMQASEKRLISTITELEGSLASVEFMRKKADEKSRESDEMTVAAANLQHEKSAHVRTISALGNEIEDHKATIGAHVDRITRLEQLQASAHEQAEEAAQFRIENEKELDSQRQHISRLEEQIRERESSVEFHKHGLKSLHDSHSREIDGLRSEIDAHSTAKADAEQRLQEMQAVYTAQIGRLETEVIDLKDQLERAKAEFADELRESKAACDSLEKQRDQLLQHVSTLKAEITQAAKSNEASIAEMEKIKAEKDRATNLVDELEEQLSTSYDQQQATNSRLSVLSNGQTQNPSRNSAAITALEKQLEASQNQVEQLQAQMRENQTPERTLSSASNLRKSASITTLPSPPPAIPLPPLPTSVTSPTSSTFPSSSTFPAPPNNNIDILASHTAALEEKDSHIRQMEKHLFAEKQLTATLEEALVDLETQGNKIKLDMEGWKKKCWSYEDELKELRKERSGARYSVQAVEEERDKRRAAEQAREKLEERMRAVEKKKKKGGFNCF